VANKKPYKVKVTIGDSVVEVEGEEKGVVAIVQALSDALRAGRKTQESVAEPAALEPSRRSGQVDIRTFFQEKQPSSDLEAAAAAAYFYKYLATPEERRDAIDADILVNAFRLAKRPLPAKAAYTLVNARNAGYLESTGETGSYRLNPVGFNLVEHTLGKGEGSDKKGIRRKRSRRRQKGSKTRGR
jgi:hypothetical protein